MRRVCGLLVLVMFLGTMVASAEITRGKDDFTGGVTINASSKTSDPSDLKALYFTKFINSNPIDYEIHATKVTFTDFIFVDTFMEIKIDDNPVQQLPVKEAKKMSLVRESDIYSSVTIAVPNNLIPQINKASRIALRFQTAAGSYVYVLPDASLVEWKQVIDTGK